MERKIKKAKKKEVNVWTVVSVDLLGDFPGEADTDVVGSWKSRPRAVKDCVDYMIERIKLRPDIRYCMSHDMFHKGLVMEVSKASGVSRRTLLKKFDYDLKEGWEMSSEIENALRGFLCDSLAVDNEYCIVPEVDGDLGNDTFLFKICHNPLRG